MKSKGNESMFEIIDFEKYVDENFNPLLDRNGRVLYEVDVLDSVSPDAQKIGRILFEETVLFAKARRGIKPFPQS